MQFKVNQALVPFLLSGLLLQGCAKANLTNPDVLPPIQDGEVANVASIPNKSEFLAFQGSDVKKALITFEKTGQASVITTDQVIKYPYGYSTPTVVCSPLHTCDLVFELGEKITGVYPGDTARWLFEVANSGANNSQQMHVIFKPKMIDIATNAIITTSVRTYHVNLQSKDLDTASQPVAFYYPDEVEQEWIAFQAQATQAAQLAKQQQAQDQQTFNPKNLDFHYQIETNLFGAKPIWMPVRAFNDGVHVYIQMPDRASTTALPALFILGRDGNPVLVNFRVRAPYYVVDQLFSQAIMETGVGQNQQRVTITYNG